MTSRVGHPRIRMLRAEIESVHHPEQDDKLCRQCRPAVTAKNNPCTSGTIRPRWARALFYGVVAERTDCDPQSSEIVDSFSQKNTLIEHVIGALPLSSARNGSASSCGTGIRIFVVQTAENGFSNHTCGWARIGRLLAPDRSLPALLRNCSAQECRDPALDGDGQHRNESSTHEEFVANATG